MKQADVGDGVPVQAADESYAHSALVGTVFLRTSLKEKNEDTRRRGKEGKICD
jgi:hypothetical protein